VAGLAAGALTAWWLEDRAPNYGRVALIQSGALMGALAGALAVPALGFDSGDRDVRTRRMSWGVFGGLNAGLAAGLAMAYLPDQTEYGPTWQRVGLIDLAAAAGGFTGALLQICMTDRNSFCNATDLNESTARFALAGSAIGMGLGWLLTMNYDQRGGAASERTQPLPVPVPAALPVQAPGGQTSLVPGMMSQGRF
jgi:hypothetical protein